MNKNRHRLVFDRRRGMRVAAAEHVRSAGKAALGAVGAAGVAAFAPLAWAAPPIPKAADLAPRVALPVRSTDAARRATDWGNFQLSNPSATQLRIDQASLRAVINWDSFDIGAGHKVQFVQPDKGSTLNKIWDTNPSVVRGRIEANGEVILQNTNGVIFAPTARIETGRFVATALRVAEEAYKAGLRGITDGSPAFTGLLEESAGFVSLERGAEVRTAAGGDVLIIAPRVVNEGRIETPDGQTVLGAGQTVYLAASADPAQRGLLVGIKPFVGDKDLNTVTQAEAKGYKTVNGETVADSTAAGTAGLVEKVNAIVAERGAINLVALAIRQIGLLQATTAVKGRNGVIQLQAQADINPLAEQSIAGKFVNVPQTIALGSVTLGAQSVTQVLPSTDTRETQLGAETFNRSRVRVEGERIHVAGGATVRVPSGTIEMLASNAPDRSIAFDPNSFDLADHATDPSRIVVGAGATLDVAGLKNVALPASRDQVRGRLFQIELADSPVQRGGVLYREEIFFDARKAPTIANVAGFYATVTRTAEELSTTGGRIDIQSDGGVAVDARALIDISGGSLAHAAGQIKTSVVRQGEHWITVDKADKSVRYDELGNSKTRTDAANATWRVEDVAAYVEGKDAGSATFAGRRMYFAGEVKAQAIVGTAQTGRAAAATPAGGTLEFGRTRLTDSSLPSATLQAGPARRRPSTLFDDPLATSVDEAMLPTLVLSVDLLHDAGLASLKTHVANRLAVTEGTRVALASGGDFLAEAGSAEIAGEIVVPAGRIEISTQGAAGVTHDIALGSKARLDTSGTWTVDSTTLAIAGSDGTAPVALNGGSVQLAAASSLVAADGAQIDVSAGARRVGSVLTRGKAGSVGLQLNDKADIAQALPGSFDAWHAKLSAFDFANGGKLSIAGLPSLTLGGAARDAYFGDTLFNSSGFGSVGLSSLGDVRLAQGLDLSLQLKNFVPLTGPGATDAIGRFATVGTQEVASKRAPVSLSLSAVTVPNRATGVAGAALDMEAGARVATEAGGKLEFTARRSLAMNGTLDAPGGTIALTLAGTRGGGDAGGIFEDTLGFDPTQALWLGPNSTLSVAGTTELSQDRLGRSTGTVYGGGTIALKAERGYVVAQSGSVLDLRGFAAEVLTTAGPLAQQVSKSGGDLTIASPEGVHLAATLRAQAADAQADGGSLSLALSLDGRERKTSGPAYSTAAREVRIVDGAAPLLPGLLPGTDLQAALGNGLAVLPNASLKAAGFAQVGLKADDRIVFVDNLALSAPRALVLDTPALTGASGTETTLTAQHVALGDRRIGPRASFETAPAARAGDATLEVYAGLVDVHGSMALDGFKFSSLNATVDAAGGATRRDGEIRLIGSARGQSAEATGSLRFAGELQFTAGQSYATTMSAFSVEGLAGNAYFASYLPAGGSTSAAPLSALGALALKADWIDLGGVLRQPFGRIEAHADKLRVLDGAMLSVAGDSGTVPVGTTVNASQWQYRPSGLYRADGAAKPVDANSNPDIRTLAALPLKKGLVLDGKSLAVADGAQLSAAAGGSLQAWEFVAGVGGSSDYFASPGLYAVLPGRSYDFAPYDAEVMRAGAAASLRAGEQIEITMAGSALAPGRYTLLPARYALLPGAVLVSLVAEAKGALQAPIHNDDGSAVVVGAFTAIGSAAVGAPGSRILVEPAATARARSQIDVASVGTLLSRTAERLDLPLPALPSDAGRIALTAASPLRLNTQLDLANRAGGRGGELDLAVTDGRIAIVDDIAALPAGLDGTWSAVSVGSLARSGAGSVLVGGTRSGDSGSLVTPSSRAVSLLATAQALATDETMLVARGELTLAPGSALQSNVAAAAALGPRSIVVAGDAAYALASSASDVEVTRLYAAGESAGTTGRLDVADGARVAATSVALGASFSLALGADATLQTANLGLAARRIAFGSPVQADEQTTVLDGSVLAQLGSLSSLKLTSLTGIDFHGVHALALDRLVIDAPTLRGIGGKDGAVAAMRFEAREVSLRNTSSAAADVSIPGIGTLEIVAVPQPTETTTGGLTVGSAGGTQGTMLLGFDAATLGSAGDVIFAGSGGLSAQRDLTLSAARVTAQTGAAHTIAAVDGLLRVEQRKDARTLGEHVGQGAALRFQAARIEQDGTVAAPGGMLDFAATGVGALTGLRFGAGSNTSAAGSTVQAGDNWAVHGDAGRIVASATRGLVELGGLLDVSAPGNADAGMVALAATAGAVYLRPGARLQGQGGAGARQGAFSVDAAALREDGYAGPQIDTWVQALDRGGFHDSVDLRVRRTDIELAGATLRAARVSLAADRGSITLGGVVDAHSASGGSVRIHAGNDATLDGRIDARSTRAGANGGDVTLGAAAGTLTLAATAAIDASGDDTADGRIVLRTPRDDGAGTVSLSTGAGFDSSTQLSAAEIAVEAVRTYRGYSSLVKGAGGGTKLGQTTLRDDNQAFADNTSGALAAPGLAQDPRVSLRSGVQVIADGDFMVVDDWNLWQAGRPGGQPGFLTIRAAGNLAIKGSISDGFASAARPNGASLVTPTEIKEGAAWSMRLVAGADTAAADPLATRAGAAADLVLSNDKLIRTTAGSIELAAAQDIRLGTGGANTQQGVVYVAGRPSTANTELALAGSNWVAQFTSHGGSVELTAGRDVVSAPATQTFGNWFYHTGVEDQTAVAWWSAFDAYRQGIASFGGGNVRVRAGRDVAQLGVAAPTSALAATPPTAAVADPAQQPVPLVENGGDIDVVAGRDIRGGTYFLGRGEGRLQAGGAIASAPSFNPARVPGVGPVLGLMDGRWQLDATGAVELAAVLNPTMLPPSNRASGGRQRIGDVDGAVFFTYAPDSALSASSQAGKVAWQAERPTGETSMSAYWSTLAANGPAAERIDWTPKYADPTAWAPPIVSLQALGSDASVSLPGFSSGLTQFPSAQGQLSLYAKGTLGMAANVNTLALAMSDRTPASLPSTATPVLAQPGGVDAFTATSFDAPTDAAKVRFDGVHAGDSAPVRLHAGGDIDFDQGTRSSRVVLVMPKSAEITAGGDIRELSYIGQHGSAAELTRIEAGGSLLQGTHVSARITLAGPGTLELKAGRQLDLGASQGVETVGNVYRSALPARGADLVLGAGLRATLDVATFTQRYLTAGTHGSAADAQAQILADSYLTATGRDPAALDSEGAALRARLVQRYASQIGLWGGGDAAAVEQRRAQLVAGVRSALGLPVLAPTDSAAAYETSLAQFKGLTRASQTAIAERMLGSLFVQNYLAPGQPYAARWQQAAAAAGVDPAVFAGSAFERLRREILFAELNVAGGLASPLSASATETRKKTYDIGFLAADLAGLGSSFAFAGDLDMVASGVQTRNGGSITLLAPGGQVNVGLPGTGSTSPTKIQGAVSYGQGGVSSFSDGDFQVNSQRVFVVGQGDITVWSSRANIDAGRGANTAVSIPPLVAVRQADGSIAFTLPALTVGSGIGILQPAVGQAAGDIGLYAPNGEVRALDAQIRAPGRITLAAEVVRGADNISGGSVVGAPAVVPSVPVSLPSAAPSAGEAQAASGAGTAGSAAQARERNSLLMVELLGLGAATETDPCEGVDAAECERRKKAQRR